MRRPKFLMLLAAIILAGGAYWAVRANSLIAATYGGSSESAFENWLSEAPDRLAEFRAFEAFLEAENVVGIVPSWQLMRVDTTYAQQCGISHFAIPPSALWRNILPALRLTRERVIAAVGPVEVLSSFRSEEANVCARGASASKHLTFSALDLATSERRTDAALYRQLCEIRRIAGAGSNMGLGAYFNINNPDTATGRFHIDAEGYRTWGSDYTSSSSPCSAFDQE